MFLPLLVLLAQAEPRFEKSGPGGSWDTVRLEAAAPCTCGALHRQAYRLAEAPHERSRRVLYASMSCGPQPPPAPPVKSLEEAVARWRAEPAPPQHTIAVLFKINGKAGSFRCRDSRETMTEALGDHDAFYLQDQAWIAHIVLAKDRAEVFVYSETPLTLARADALSRAVAGLLGPAPLRVHLRQDWWFLEESWPVDSPFRPRFPLPVEREVRGAPQIRCDVAAGGEARCVEVRRWPG